MKDRTQATATCARCGAQRAFRGSRWQVTVSAEVWEKTHRLALATVRKAVKVLRDEGLVRTVPGWGTYIAERG